MPELSQDVGGGGSAWDVAFDEMPGLAAGRGSIGAADGFRGEDVELFIDVGAAGGDRGAAHRPSGGPHTSRGVPASQQALRVDTKKLKGSRSVGASPRSPVAKPPRSPRAAADRQSRHPGVGGRPSGTGPPPQPVAPDVLEQLTTKQLQKQFYSQYQRVTTANNRGWLVRKLSEGWSPGMQFAINWEEMSPSGSPRTRAEGAAPRPRKDKGEGGGGAPASSHAKKAGGGRGHGAHAVHALVAQSAAAAQSAFAMAAAAASAAFATPSSAAASAAGTFFGGGSSGGGGAPATGGAPHRLAMDRTVGPVDASGLPLSASSLVSAAGPGSGGDLVDHAELGVPGAKVVGRRVEVFQLLEAQWKCGTLEGFNSRRGTARVRYDDERHEEVNFQRSVCRWLPSGVAAAASAAKASPKRGNARATLAAPAG